MKISDQINELAGALSKAQGAMSAASKDKDNPFFKSKYADLDSCWDACRKPLSDNNLSVVQAVSNSDDGKITVKTILLHESGQFIEDDLSITPVKSDPQGIGSTITYARRYGLMGMVGIAPAEDDGEAGMGRGSKSVDDDFKEIYKLQTPEEFKRKKKEISQINDQSIKKKLGSAFNNRLKQADVIYDPATDSFLKINCNIEWYQAEADKQKDVIGWWKKEHGRAKDKLSEADMKKMESYVSQLFDTTEG